MENFNRKLDWKPYFDERSKSYPVSSVFPQNVNRVYTKWDVAEILDQGSEGACVGFAWTAEALNSPVMVNLKRVAANVPRVPYNFAIHIYKEAQKIDHWPGEDYEGTSVLAGAQMMQKYNLLRQYRWAFNIDQIIDSIVTIGPVVLGVNWYQGMYRAPNGVLKVFGDHVGGHAILAIGYNPSSDKHNGKPTIILQNSWGKSWGIDGIAEIAVEDLAELMKQRGGGEACVPVLRDTGEKKNTPFKILIGYLIEEAKWQIAQLFNKIRNKIK